MSALLLSSTANFASSQSTCSGSQGAVAVKFYCVLNGQASLTSTFTLTSPEAARLYLPSNASEGSNAICLYAYNGTLNSLQSFQVYTSFVDAVPRLVIALDTNGDGLIDTMLMSDYQMPSNGSWQLTQGGERWGWTVASIDLASYGASWNTTDYWKTIYGNADVIGVGVALEYWAVKDSGGLNQALYADEVVLNGVTYNIAGAEQQSNTPTPDNWSMYRHDPQRSGVSQSNGTDGGNLLWKFFTGPSSAEGSLALANRLRASPAIVNGVIYMGTNNTSFYALNATTGKQIWEIGLSANVDSSAAVANGVVYVGILWNGRNGYVDALNATDGSIIWQYVTNSGIESSPVVVNGIVYVGSAYGYVYALDATNGALKWAYLTGGQTFSSPAVVNGVVYIGSLDGKVYALNADSGSLIWSSQVGDSIYASPVVADNVVYINTDGGQVLALTASDGLKIWQASIGMGDHADDSPAVANGIVYAGDRNGYYAFNATNGNQIWFFTSPYTPRQTTGYVYSSPAIVGNVVYFGSCDSYLFALNAYTGTMIWSYLTGGFLFSSPAIADGNVYIGSYDGYIYAFSAVSAPALPPANQPTPTPTPTATPAPTPKPTATPAPNPTPTPAPTAEPNINQQAIYVATPQPTHPSAPLSTTEPYVTASNGEVFNWIMLGGILTTLLAFFAILMLTLRRKPT